MIARAIALGLIEPFAGSPTKRAGDREAGDLGAEPGEALQAGGRDGDVAAGGALATNGARMIVERASPVLVVKTVLSVLDGAAESSRTNCLSVTCSV